MPLSAHNLSRSFGKNHAVVDTSFTIEPGTITALVGPNGCGKTTTMLMLAGLLAPDAGWVSVDGQVVTSADPKHRFSNRTAAKARSQIGWVPDEFGSWPSLGCLEVLETFAAFYQIPNPRTRAREVLEQFGMEDFAKQRLITLSRGQKQRLGLARALLHQPKYLILDEPSNGMDPAARRDLLVLLRELASHGRGILISSHILKELNDIVDDAIIMRVGRIVSDQIDARLRWSIEILNPSQWDTFIATVDSEKWQVDTIAFANDQAPSISRREPALPGEIRLSVRTGTTGTGTLTAIFSAEDEAEAAEFVAQACAHGVRICRMESLRYNLEQQYLESEQHSLTEEPAR